MGGSIKLELDKDNRQNWTYQQGVGGTLVGYTGTPITDADIEKVMSVKGIRSYNGVGDGSVFAMDFSFISGFSFGPGSDYSRLPSVSNSEYFNYFRRGAFKLVEGRHITPEDDHAVLISTALAERNGALEGLVKQLFVELKRDFKPSDLPPYTLVKLGMHLAGTSQPEESISYFDEILDPSEPDPVRKKARINGMSKYRKNAVFGKAVALGRSKDNAKVDTAIKMMRDELSKEESSSNPDRKAMEDAQYNLVKFTSARQDWPAVIAAADKYRENKTYKKNLPEVLYLQGEAYLKQNELDKALINFMNITGTYKGLVKWSAPAVLAQMDTLWKRNTMSQGAGKQPSDRYVAWKAGSQYVQLLDTPANRKKMTAEDSALVNEVKDKTAKFGSDPAVSQERADIAAYEAAVRAAKGQK